MRNRISAGLPVMGAIVVLLVGSLSLQAQSLSRPEQFAGFAIGSDGNLVRWERIVEYMNRADAASDRILVEEIGKTTLDNPFLLITVSSPRNLARLDQIKAVQRRLAYPYDLSDREVERIAWESPAVLFVTLNIHSSEIGSSQMALELICRLATEDSPWVENVLDNVIVFPGDRDRKEILEGNTFKSTPPRYRGGIGGRVRTLRGYAGADGSIHLSRPRVLAGADTERVEGPIDGRILLPRIVVENSGRYTTPGGFWYGEGSHCSFRQ